MTVKIQFNEEEIKATIEEWVKEQEHRKNQKNEFRVTEREQVLLDLLPIIEKEGSVNDEELLYQKEKYPFSSEAFIFLVETIEEYAKQFQLTFEEEDLELATEGEEEVEETYYFSNSCCALRFKEKTLIFRTMHGQGTVSSVWEHDPKTESTPPFVISYETLVKHEHLVDNKPLFDFFNKYKQYLFVQEEIPVEGLPKEMQEGMQEIDSTCNTLQEKVYNLHKTFYK